MKYCVKCFLCFLRICNIVLVLVFLLLEGYLVFFCVLMVMFKDEIDGSGLMRF